EKPKMLIIHKSWCKACKGLKEKISSSKEIEDLSRDFVMINSDDEDESQKSDYDIDGKYVPRIFFYGKDGKPLKTIFNERREKHKYFYSKPKDIVTSMKAVLEKEKKTVTPLDRGFNDNIKWMTFDDAEKESRASGKPMMVLIHKTWCGSCKILRPKFAASKDIEVLSERFVMVNTEDDEEPKDSAYAVDGAYIPRIYFVEPSGRVMDEIWNKETSFPDNKYYYGEPDHIVRSMKLVMEMEFSSNNRHRGFGERIDWLTFEEGQKESKKSGKPMMIIIHKTWCGSCTNLKPKFAASDEILELSKNFIMVNTEDDEEPKDSKFVVDGAYIPRIFFVEPSGRVMNEVWNEGTAFPHVKYYYGEADEIVRSMKLVIAKENNSTKLHNGWGKQIKWETLENGLTLFRERKVPMLLIIYKSWCKACKVLKTYFSKSEEIVEFSSKFVMVNIQDDKEELGEEFDVDGAYVPRLYFFDPRNGRIMEEFHNESPEYKDDFIYSYGNEKQVIKTMKKVLEKQEAVENDRSRGFGGKIEWTSFNDSVELAKEINKPIMLIFHRSWCQFSRDLKEEFAQSLDLSEISKYFVMVNVEDDEIPNDKKFDLDGTYVPRILFLDSEGNVDNELMNENRREKSSKYFYQHGIDVVASMKKALEKQPPPSLERGFGIDYEWMSMENALSEAATSEKPIFLIIHRPLCGACQYLKNVFNQSKELPKYAQDFVMVNMQDDEIPEGNQYDIDGKYFPRVFILDPNGVLQRDLHNMDPEYLQYKFSYSNEMTIIRVMNDALARFKLVQTSDHDFGENVDWVSYKEGVALSKQSNKPMMLIIHKTWCSACKALKKKVAGSTKFAGMSKNFVMVNSEDDEDPDDELFEIDGSYVPRTFFIDPSGETMVDIYNSESMYKKNKYYYWDAIALVKSMEKVLDKLKMNSAQRDEL
ncbi:Thioredoxin domain-containing 12, partial [Paramuricea clavata]